MNSSVELHEEIILQIREFSRKLVRELGFMRPTLAGSSLAPSAVHAVIEIGMAPGITVKNLSALLKLDKSNTSRQIARLETAGIVRRCVATDDARAIQLYLTVEGEELKKRIDQFATNQVAQALRQIPPVKQQALLVSLMGYTEALACASGASPPILKRQEGQIFEGYQPGCVGDIVALHARFYSRNWRFGATFEQKVAREMAEFVAQLPAEGKAIWLYTKNGRALASLAIDGNHKLGHAHLRWFIVDDTLRGAGIGRDLLKRAINFVDTQGFHETYLWTFKGLEAARHLYESFGFSLMNENEGEQWGRKVLEQRFCRRIPDFTSRDIVKSGIKI